ncbi:MAG: transposase zinc-binding domain-containing protein, partial [Fuerstiella sp.]
MAATASEQAGGQQRTEPAFRVHDILKNHAGMFVETDRSAACPQVQSTLAKISMCPTGALGGSWHWCAACETGIRIPNSCGDRHCPQCRGAQRATWVDRMRPLLLPDVDCYQVVFTIPAELSSLTLGNRRAMFNLLFYAAWQSLKKVLEDEQAYDGRKVTFTARTGTTHGGSDDIEEVEVTAVEFVRRWCLHVLPKGFTKSRRFGGWSNYHRERYVREGRDLTGNSGTE